MALYGVDKPSASAYASQFQCPHYSADPSIIEWTLDELEAEKSPMATLFITHGSLDLITQIDKCAALQHWALESHAFLCSAVWQKLLDLRPDEAYPSDSIIHHRPNPTMSQVKTLAIARVRSKRQ